MNSKSFDAVDESQSRIYDWPSVDQCKPLEEGGPEARRGFNYQDEIAVSFLLDMIEDPSIIRIHCETHDDIVVVRDTGDGKENCAEYVQVKASELDQLWTIATLCQRKNSKQGTSILGRSIAHDRCNEKSRFSVVTLRQVSAKLRILTFPILSEARVRGRNQLNEIKSEIEKKCSDLVSPKGNDCVYWLENCHWDVRNDEESVRCQNVLRVYKISCARGSPMLHDSIVSLLDEMRLWAMKAGSAPWVPDRAKKIIPRNELCQWWDKRANEILSASHSSGGNLVRKMKEASLPQDVINSALDLRRKYTRSLRTPRYADDDITEDLLAQVQAELISLRSRYTAGLLDVDAQAFHVMCLDKMDEINRGRQLREPDLSPFLKGCLYDVADRCLLKFEKMAI